MTRLSKIGKVKRLLHQNEVDGDLCSPNYIAEFTSSRGIKLTSEEVIQISDTYDLTNARTKLIPK